MAEVNDTSIQEELLDIATIVMRHGLVGCYRNGVKRWRSPGSYSPALSVSEIRTYKPRRWSGERLISGATFTVIDSMGGAEVRVTRSPQYAELVENEFGQYILDAFKGYLAADEDLVCVGGLVRATGIPHYGSGLLVEPYSRQLQSVNTRAS